MKVLGMRHAAAVGVLLAVEVAGQCGPGGENGYPPGSTECPSEADGMAAHVNDNPAPAAAPQDSSEDSSSVCAVGPCPANLLGNIGYTTASGTDERTGITFSPGEDMFGPFEAGFNSMQESILTGLGCNPASDGYLPGGIDTQTASEMLAYSCNMEFPRIEEARYIALLDECGGHTNDYHFHQLVSCLYTNAAGSGHSAQVGKGLDGQSIYGQYEDFSTQKKPLLDACGGHFGVTPTSDGKVVYHYHVQERAPFFIGCSGPAKDETTGDSKLVTVAECRAAFATSCGNGDEITVTTKAGSYQYDPYCPCFDEAGSNMGTGERAIFSTAGEQLTCDSTCVSEFTPVSVETTSASGGGLSNLIPIMMIVGGIAFAVVLLCVVCRSCAGGSSKRGGYKENPGEESYDEEQSQDQSDE